MSFVTIDTLNDMKGKDSVNDGVDDGQADVDSAVVLKDSRKMVSGVRNMTPLSSYRRMLLCDFGVREDLPPGSFEADEKIRELIFAVLDGGDMNKLLFPFANSDKNIHELLFSVLAVHKKIMLALIYTMESEGEVRDRLEAIYAVSEDIQRSLEKALCRLLRGRQLPSLLTLAEDDEPTTRRTA